MNNNSNGKIRILTFLLCISLAANVILGYLYTDNKDYKRQYDDAMYTIETLHEESRDNYDIGYDDGYADARDGYANTSDESSYSERYIGTTVYITDTGSKYHRYGCQYLRQSCHEISLSDAKTQGYTPCSRCY